ncbi:MAG: peptidoglycan DD-metalloendopeptidase family protein [Bacteroidota bacterium]
MINWIVERSNGFKTWLLVVGCSLLVMGGAFGQSTRAELEEKRKQLLREIDQTTRLLKQTKQNREATYSRYVTLQRQINRRLQLIKTLQQEVLLLLENVERTTGAVEALSEDVGRLKSEYALMVRHAYRQRLMRNDWLFVLSATSFNDAFRRWQYLRQYDRYRQKQAQLILDTQETLLEKIASLEKRKSEKERLLSAEERQSEMLGLEISAKNRILEELKGDESRLSRQLKAKEKAAKKLTAAIENIIKTEMEKARLEEERARANVNVSPSTATGKSAESLSSEFRASKGVLPLPVRNGVITSYFGKQQHPTIKTVQIVNNGIDIRTDQGAQVQSIFEGTVVGTQFIPGFDYMVILQHGEYYTVYSNLQEVKVRKGDRVGIRQSVGIVSTDRKTNTAEVHFEIWKGKTRLNPTNWVKQ